MPARRALKYACLATLGVAFIEFVGGKLAGSLALMADAAHLVGDAGALGLAFFAAVLANRPATRKMSYGFHRVEILAALVNGVGLVTIAIFVIRAALHRFASPPEVQAVYLLGLGAVGLVFNLTIALFLRGFAQTSLNVRSAFYHVLADFLGSLGVVVAGVLIWKGRWLYADPLVSLGIASLIIWGAWRLLHDVVAVLLEATPVRVDMDRLESRLLALAGVEEICDLHVWTISSGKEALSAHLGVRSTANPSDLLKQVNALLVNEFGIRHSTIQIEETQHKPHKPLPTHRPHEF